MDTLALALCVVAASLLPAQACHGHDDPGSTPAGPTTASLPELARDAPIVERIEPAESEIIVGMGQTVHFRISAFDPDCDLVYFQLFWDELQGMPCVIFGCQFSHSWDVYFDEDCCEYVGIYVCDSNDDCGSAVWHVTVASPVSPTSWGCIKGLYR